MLTTGDPEHTGKINPQTATRIFSASNLPPGALARIWEIASVDSKDGLLDRQGVGVALRLIGHAQSGATVTEALVKTGECPVATALHLRRVSYGPAGPLAVLENISPLPIGPIAGPSTGLTFDELPPLTAHDKAKFRKIFKGNGAKNGILSGALRFCLLGYDSHRSAGSQAKDVFMKSKLPWNTLSEIWYAIQKDQDSPSDHAHSIVHQDLSGFPPSGFPRCCRLHYRHVPDTSSDDRKAHVSPEVSSAQAI